MTAPHGEGPPAQGPPVRRRVAVLALGVLVAVGLLASEAVVRLMLPSNSPETLRAYSLEYESSLFTRIRLAPVGRMVEVDPEKAWGTKPPDAPSHRTFHINRLGFRGPDFAPRKPEGTTRVFVLGGSAVFDQNVSDRDAANGASWPNRAQSLLRDRGIDVEVVNAGTPSHSTVDALGRLISEIWLYEPDVVVLYNGWNDLKNVRAWAISPERPLARLMSPFDPATDPYRHYQGPLDRLFSRSQLYLKFRNAYLGSRTPVGFEGFMPEGDVSSTYEPFGLRQFEQNVRNFVDIVRNMDALPVLSTQVTSVVAQRSDFDEQAAAEYQLLDGVGMARAYEELHEVTRAVAAEMDVPLFDAAVELDGEMGILDDHVHLSPEGSQAMARLLAEFLAPMIGVHTAEGRGLPDGRAGVGTR